jgi:hypothetical protein
MAEQNEIRATRIPAGTALITTFNTPIGETAQNQKPTIDKPIVGDLQPRAWALWGENDTWPLDWKNFIGKSGVALSGIEINADMHYGAGFQWMQEVTDENGELVSKKVIPPGWNKFIKKTGAKRLQTEIIHSLETFYIAFVEVILTRDRKEIAFMQLLDTCYCRKQKKDEKGRTSKMFYSSNFGNTWPDEPAEIPLFDPNNPKKHAKFCVILEYSTYGRNYYPQPNLESVILNGWYDVTQSVPKNISAIYKNQISPKYQIFIPIAHFEFMYKDWDNKSEVEQLQLIQTKKEEIESSLTGEENANKSFISIYDGVKENFTIEIVPIESPLDKVKSTDLPTNAIGNAEICTALNVAPSLGGITIPGGSNLSGSGSDVRENRKSKQANLTAQHEVSIGFLDVIALVNGYNEDYYACYIDIDTSDTLDVSKSSGKEVIQTDNTKN